VLVEVLGLARLLREVAVGSSLRLVVFPVVGLALNALLGILVLARLHFLQRR
jgi:hypothetical protein